MLDTQTIEDGDIEVLIKRQHLPSIENSWEATTTINKEFPTFHLKGKLELRGEGIDWFNGKVYVRRNKIKN